MIDSMTPRCSGPVAVKKKKSPRHHSSTTVLGSCYEVFVLICCICLFINKRGTVYYSQTSYFGLICPKELLERSGFLKAILFRLF